MEKIPFLEHFEDLKDPRSDRNKLYLVDEIGGDAQRMITYKVTTNLPFLWLSEL